jgi:hypothetical protein
MTLKEFLKEVKKRFTGKKRKELNGACERAFNHKLKEYRK